LRSRSISRQRASFAAVVVFAGALQARQQQHHRRLRAQLPGAPDPPMSCTQLGVQNTDERLSRRQARSTSAPSALA